MERAIKDLAASDEENDEIAALLNSELNYLDNEIHLLDHRKGEAEKALAKMLEELYGTGGLSRQAERLKEAQNHVSEMEQLHDEFVDRIGILRDRVLTEIDRLIEQVSLNHSPRAEAGDEIDYTARSNISFNRTPR